MVEMSTIMDYITYYKDKRFDEIPFNDVDALILAEFSYIELDDLLRKENMPITLGELGDIYFSKVTKEKMKGRAKLYRETYDLFEAMKDTKRFKDLMITNYICEVDLEKQFCAMTFRNGKKWTYIAFEGTDSSIIGWKEDFALSHTFPVLSQKMALHYLEEEVRFLDQCVYVGGHSKGGNLALASSLKSSSFVRHRLKAIYNFDGPGLREKEYRSLNYSKIKPKIKMFVPSESMVGMLLNHDLHYQVVKSNIKGMWQHDAFTWECFGSVFIPDQLSRKSIQFSTSMKKFLEEIPDDERLEFVEAFFSIFDKSGISNTEHITLSKILKCISCIGDLTADKKMKEKLKKIFNILLKMYST